MIDVIVSRAITNAREGTVEAKVRHHGTYHDWCKAQSMH